MIFNFYQPIFVAPTISYNIVKYNSDKIHKNAICFANALTRHVVKNRSEKTNNIAIGFNAVGKKSSLNCLIKQDHKTLILLLFDTPCKLLQHCYSSSALWYPFLLHCATSKRAMATIHHGKSTKKNCARILFNYLVVSIYSPDSWYNVYDVEAQGNSYPDARWRYRQHHVRLFFIISFLRYMRL